jgi:hypothetical protein
LPALCSINQAEKHPQFFGQRFLRVADFVPLALTYEFALAITYDHDGFRVVSPHTSLPQSNRHPFACRRVVRNTRYAQAPADSANRTMGKSPAERGTARAHLNALATGV